MILKFKKNMFDNEVANINDIVSLETNIPEFKLYIGDLGTITEIYRNGKTFKVKFINQDNITFHLILFRNQLTLL